MDIAIRVKYSDLLEVLELIRLKCCNWAVNVELSGNDDVRITELPIEWEYIIPHHLYEY